MPKKGGSSFHIGNVTGDVTFSSNQSGGITSHGDNNKPNGKKPFIKKLLPWVALILPLVGVLTYFGIQPKPKPKDFPKTTLNARTKVLSKEPPSVDTLKKKLKRSKIMSNSQDPKDKQIVIKDITGNVVFSNNQTGGVTAHTFVQNTYNGTPPLLLSDEEKRKIISALPSKKEVIEIHFSYSKQRFRNYGNEIANFLRSNGYTVDVPMIGTNSFVLFPPPPETDHFYIDNASSPHTITIIENE